MLVGGVIVDDQVQLKMLGVSRLIFLRYFSRVFKRAIGSTFIEFFNRLRINKYCELLADGDKAVRDVCFGVQQYFQLQPALGGAALD